MNFSERGISSSNKPGRAARPVGSAAGRTAERTSDPPPRASRRTSGERSLVELLGGYELAAPVYVECTEEQERCKEEIKTPYAPEIQINQVVYQGPKTREALAAFTGCKLPN